MLPRAVAVLVVALGVLAPAGSAQAPPVDAPPARPVATAVPPLVSCRFLPFRPAALRGTPGYERRRGPLAVALRRFLRESADDVGQPRRGWFLLVRRGDRAEVAAGRPPGRGHMQFERRGGRWRWAGSGDCRPRTYADGLEAQTWRRAQPRAPLPPDTTRIPVLVEERDCTSGQDARGRVLSPLVHHGRNTVTVTYFVRPPEGEFFTCEGHPPTPATLVLDEPLGGRALRDGGPYPAVPRR